MYHVAVGDIEANEHARVNIFHGFQVLAIVLCVQMVSNQHVYKDKARGINKRYFLPALEDQCSIDCPKPNCLNFEACMNMILIFGFLF
jgi:hypothetical protein